MFRRLFAAISTSVLVLAACGGQGEPTAAPAQPTATTPAQGSSATPTPAMGTTPMAPASGAQPKYGGTLSIVQTADPPTFDPHASTLAVVTRHTLMTHNRLVRYGNLGHPENAKWGELRIVGDLAESWEISHDGRTFTFKLRRGVPWHNVAPMNGREVTSDDIKKAYTKLQSHEKSVFKGYFNKVESMETPDKHTFVMVLKKPLASWMQQLADGEAAWITAQDLVDAKGTDFGVAQDSLHGTGPFLPEKGEPGSRYTYVRNPNYWDKQIPYLDRLQMLVIKDTATHEAAFNSGQIHQFGARRLADVSRIQKALPQATVRETRLNSGNGGFILNMEKDLWKDVRVRRAMSLSMDRDRIMKDLYDSKADYNGCVPNGHTRYALTPEENKQLYKFDPAKAKALLAEAGVPNPAFELLAWNDNQVYLDEMQMYQQDLKNVGVTMNIKTLPIRTGREFVLQGNFEANVGAHTQGASPDEILGAFTKGDPFNYMRLDDPRVQAWMAQQEVEYDTTKRWPIFKEFARVCADEVLGLIPLPNRYTFTLTQGFVKNYMESDLSTDEPKEWWVWIER